MIRVLLIAIVMSIPSFAGAQLPSPPPEIASGNVTVDHYPAHDVIFPNGVKGIPDIIYWEPLGYRPLTLDLYLPPQSLKRPELGFPLVIYIHGGGWMGGDAKRAMPFADFPGVLASLSARGYVVASIEYRLSGEAKFPAQAQDIKAAIRWLRLNALKYDIDPARAITWGVSAGGHLSALAAVSCNSPALEPKQTFNSFAAQTKTDPIPSSNASDCVQGGISWYGVFDMATIAVQSRKDKAMSRDVAEAPEWRLLDCAGSACTQQQLAAASPVAYVDRDDPPMLLIVGTEDTTVPYSQTLEMAEKLRASGVKHELIVLPGINHSFIGKTPEQTRDANLKAIEVTFQFIDKTIGKTIPTGLPQPPPEAVQTGVSPPTEVQPPPAAIQKGPSPPETPQPPPGVIREEPTTGMKILDIALVRPLCVVGSTISTAAYIAVSPLAFIMGVAKPAARVMVEAPWRFTAFRYVGQFDHYVDEQPIMGVWEF